MDYTIIIRPLIGAVIGYSTNWLAIKMLFRPHEEKYIGKIKLPFTPGVIPRERDRIARSLGAAVGDQLLTEEVITKELLNGQVTGHIKSYIIEDLLDKDLSLEDLLRAVLGEGTETTLERMAATIVTEIGMYLNNPLHKEDIRAGIVERLEEVMAYDSQLDLLLSVKVAEESQVIVKHNIADINGYILELAGREAVRVKLARAIETIVMDKVGALGAMFLDGPSMVESILVYLDKLLKEDETQEGIALAVKEGVTSLGQRQLDSLVSRGQYQEIVTSLADRLLQGIIGFATEEKMMAMVTPMVGKFVKRKIHLEEDQKAKIEIQIEGLYNQFVERNIGTFLNSFDVSAVVEDEINRFSVMEIEKLIFGIIDKELQTITWLGGLLGFIIGLVYVVL